jgi:hypothetical protein
MSLPIPYIDPRRKDHTYESRCFNNTGNNRNKVKSSNAYCNSGKGRNANATAYGCKADGRSGRTHAICYKGPDEYPKDDASRVNCCANTTKAHDCNTDYYYNPTTTTSGCKTVLTTYCEKNLDDDKCKKLNLPSSTIEEKTIYGEAAKVYCVEDKLNTPSCQRICNENIGICKNRLTDICADKVGNAAWSSTCACFYPGKVYTDIRKAVKDKYTFPDKFLDSRPKCIFKGCRNASIKDESGDDCDKVNVATCVKDVNITQTGATIGNIDETSEPKCGLYSDAPDNYDVNDDDDECTKNSDCETGKSCRGGVCALNIKEDPPIYKNKWFIIGIVLAIALIGGLIAYFKSK